MKVKFWGCRGSIPASNTSQTSRNKAKGIAELMIQQDIRLYNQLDGFVESLPFHLRGTYGTNTCCVQIIGSEEVIICDAGSGLRDLGNDLVQMMPNMPKVYHLIMSHLHWDHIQGFPFFVPAYMQGVTINIYGCHTTIEDAFIKQQATPTFPVALKDMGSNIVFHTWDKSEKYRIGGVDISIIEQPHPGLSYGYKFSRDGKTIIYSTDAEHTAASESDDYPFLDFIRDANILIFDGQFQLADHLYTKQNWGHSSNLVGIEMANRAKVNNLVLFHSDHNFSDLKLDQFLEQSVRYQEIFEPDSKVNIVIPYDGLTMEA